MTEAERIADHFHHWHQTICRAGGIRHDGVFGRIIFVAVHTHYDGDVLTFGGRGNKHLLGSAVDVLASSGRVGEATSGFEHDVYAKVLPRKRTWILLGKHLDLVAVDDDRVFSHLDVSLIRAVHRVVLEQVRQRLRVSKIVHRDEFQIGDAVVLCRAHNLPPNASKSVDTYPCCHSFSSIRLKPVATGVRAAESHVTDYPRT